MCEKRTYRTAKGANRALANLKMQSPKEPGGKKPVRRYECPECGYWHLTSQTKVEYWRSLSDINVYKARRKSA